MNPGLILPARVCCPRLLMSFLVAVVVRVQLANAECETQFHGEGMLDGQIITGFWHFPEISALANKGKGPEGAPSPSEAYVAKEGEETFYANVCTDVNYQSFNQAGHFCKGEGGSTFEGTTDVLMQDGGQTCYSLGKHISYEPIQNDYSKGLTLMFSGGDPCHEPGTNWTSSIKVSCDKNAEPYLEFEMSVQGCHVGFSMISKFACPTYSADPTQAPATIADEGLSKGWIFNICFICTVVIYIGGGIWYNRKYKDKEGCQSCPNRKRWKKLPGLVWDGIKYTGRGIKGCFKWLKKMCKGEKEMSSIKNPLLK